jgi:chemosensory pili system protein ChpA (sensor histidine kinase/response regulator)
VTGADDREFLLSVFLMEAWDTLASLEEDLARVAADPGPEWSARSRAAFHDLKIVTHRLRGSAGLHGFPRVSATAAMMEQVVDRLAALRPGGRAQALATLDDLAGSLRAAFDMIGATRQEDADALIAAMTRHASVLALPTPAAPAASALTDDPPEDAVVFDDPIATALANPIEDPPIEGPPAPLPPASAVGPPPAPGGLQRGTGESTDLVELAHFFAANPDVVSYFVPEASEHLELASASLLALEQHGRHDDDLATLFRAIHTLKGAAYTVGCPVIARLAHRMEDLLGAVREDTLPLTSPLVDALFSATDALKLMVQRADGPVPALAATVASARAKLEAVAPALDLEAGPAASAASSAVEASVDASLAATIQAEGSATAEEPATPWSPASTIGRSATPASQPRETTPTRPSIRVTLDRLDGLLNLVGELVIARSRLDRRMLQLERAGDLLGFTRARMAQTAREFERKYGNPTLPMPGLTPTAPAPAGEPLAAVFEELEFDRYDDLNILARRVSEIAEDVSEIQAQLGDFTRIVRSDTSRIQALTAELRGEITRARMVPVGRLFARFGRQVREAARAAGKTVTLELAGESVEMDNTMVEEIAGPLLHLVQNAIIHGLEPETERRAAGKALHGTVYLNAYHKGPSIYVEVADDGRGVDAERVRARAVSLGLLRPEAAARLSDREALDLIFLPGFSTATTITEAAGRGVGMDVVRTNVRRLNGEIEVETAVGVGTRFTIKLPLTVTISDAFLVRVHTDVVAVPVTAVRRILMVRPDEIRVAGGVETLRIDDEMVDLVSLPAVLGLPAAARGMRLPVLVLRIGRRSLAVEIDELLGKDEIVIKSLGDFLEGVGPFSGATIDGEGRVILLIDAARLLGAGGAESPLGAVPEPTEATLATAGSRAVLLVDDSVSIRRFVRQMLERAGFRVTTANDGADALRQLGGLNVDIVITDLEMPNVNGFELIRDLRRRPATRALPVVVLTTRSGDKHVTLARQLGVQHYVTKPVDEQALVQLVESLTAGAAASASHG